jgi:hypothetical protein
MKSTKGEPSSKPPAANRRVATSKAGGPKTAEGKRRVRHNALQHGFFSKQLIVRESEKPEFEMLRSSLLAELEPRTTMQMIAFERLLCASWRVRQALRMEQTTVNVELSLQGQQESETSDNATKPAEQVPRWYTLGRGPLGQATKMLRDLRDDVRVNGGLHLEEQRDSIVKAFGSEFYETLAQWKPESVDAVLLSEQLTQHAERFKLPLPKDVGSSDQTKLVIDQRAKWEMMIKLIDIKLQDMGEMHRLIAGEKRGSDGQPVSSDNLGRYMTSTLRELERAFQWYLQVTAMVAAPPLGIVRDQN